MGRFSYKTRYSFKYRLWVVMATLAMVFGNTAVLQPQVVLAQPAAAPQAVLSNTVTLSVISARTEPRALGGAGVTKGDAITEYKYIINVDNTGTTEQRSPADGCSPSDPLYPSSCNWTSMGIAGSSPIYTQGNQDDFAGGMTLPNGRYLISVLADGFKLDGTHFTIPMDDANPITVELQPTPLPTATMQAEIFEDVSVPNAAPDVPVEHGLAGFEGHIADYLGEVTTDVFGNPLGTEYERNLDGTIFLDAENNPTPVPNTGGVPTSKCYVVSGGIDIGTVAPEDADGRCPLDTTGLTTTLEGVTIPAGAAIEGKLKIENLGPNRYALTAVAPDGTNWIQTTTLEGNHDWDAWVMEGATGLDTEFVVAGEPFPAIFFGFVKPTPALPSGPSGHITGVVEAIKAYVPPVGGTGLPGTIWGGLAGAKLDKPIEYPWIALTDLTNGDTAIYVGQGNADGSFDIANVPDGNYTITWWDEDQNYILDLINVTVSGGQTAALGILPLTGWWTYFDGYVFNDLNRNGIKDPGEPGVPNYTLTLRKRENSLMDRGATVVSTDQTGYYEMVNGYPMTQWLVMEAYSDLYYTTGVTYQADNQPTPTTVLGAGVDVSVLPIIGLSGHMDWGVHAYDPTGRNGIDPRNGGIVGTVSYDTTRNELDPQYAAVEDWQPGISDLTVELYDTVFCGTTTAPCDPTDTYELAPDGSYARGPLLNTYVTETWQNPGLNDDGICIPRNVDGAPLGYPADQQVTNSSSDCLEGPLMGVQFQNGFSTVDGNYGFADGCFDGTLDATDPSAPVCTGGSFTTLPGGREYLVHVEIPNDVTGRPMYNVTREEDINIANGDQFIPQVPPPACVGALHTVDVANSGADSYGAVTLPNGIIVPASSPVDNATFLDIDGSPYEGMQKPLCDTKLVQLNNGKSIVPTFNLYTDVPIPGRFWGLVVDDLNFSGDPRSLLYGEKAGIPFAPVGIYDYANRLVTTVESDFNGLFDVLLPSTNRISCPTPSGVCANLYRFVGNDPGTPGQLNPNYKPQFRTIAAEFEAFPGLIVPADMAPTQVGVTVQLPGGQINQVACQLDAATPQLLSVSQPYVNDSGSVTINGVGFGASQGGGTVALDGMALGVSSWSDTQIVADVPSSAPAGAHQLLVTADNGQTTVNGLTFHVLRGNPFPQTGVLDTFTRSTNDGFGGSSGALTWFDDSPASVFNSISPTGYARVRTGTGGGSPAYTSGLGLGASTNFGTNQEAYFTFLQVSNANTSNEQGLVLKFGGSTSPASNSAFYIEVAYNNTPANSIRVRTKSPGSGTITTRATFTGVTLAANDQLGARAASDGTITVYKNGVAVGSTTYAPSATWAGRIGVRFEGTGTTPGTEARFDNFGGGNFVSFATYSPNLYEVGPGHPYATIQSAINAAAASPQQDLVVVYPGQPDITNPRVNPRGAYYENLIVNSSVKLQGVGPGGFQGNTFVPGSIIDGGAFGGDGQVATDWYTLVNTLVWDGNQNVFDGADITIYAQDGQFGSDYPMTIDGFDLRGGDQQGFPGNLNEIGGGATGLPANQVTQGGAIYANGYARYLQVTNNVIENNGGAYGTVRIGNPDLAAPLTDNQNDNVRIANNRIIANGGTNLAGGIGIFAGANNYEVANNDICGNFSAEYGGGVSVYGYSPNGSIHHNRVYFNAAYDEGGGIMIAGELPANPLALSPGSGPANIYNNLIQANLANDDGGGLRFLMAGNFPMNVYNNMIVNNVSTHEGGGIGINDAPNVRVFNNTIMKNMTTATAVTSNGLPAPAGLSTSQNSDQLQATLPGGSPIFSNPLLFNNIFWDNRAGTRTGAAVIGLGIPGDATPINYWDLGVADGTGNLSPTNSVLQTTLGTNGDPSNILSDPLVNATYDTSVAFNVWRNNPNFVGAILVAVDLPPNLLGDYHLPGTSPAVDNGALSKSGVNAPLHDYDDTGRPTGAGFDIGADEQPGAVNVGILPFPQNGVLDNFNRNNSSNLGGNWSPATGSGYAINGNALRAQSGANLITWTPTTFGADQEAYFTFVNNISTAAMEQDLVLKVAGLSGSSIGTNTTMIEVLYDRATSTVHIWTRAAGGVWAEHGAPIGVSFALGDTFGARTTADGSVYVYKNAVLVGSTNVTSGPNPWSAALAAGGGRIGLWFVSTSNGNYTGIDNFGGGTMILP